jgi:transcriptional regulator with XRE-family HTH domain
MDMAFAKTANAFSKRVQAYLDQEGLKGLRAADRLQVQHRTVYNWLRGVNLPPRAQALRIAAIIGDPEIPKMVERVRARRGRGKREAAA